MIGEAVAAIELVQMAHEQGWFERLIYAMRTKHRVLVLGPTGVGKSLFLRSLTKSLPKTISLMTRTEFVEKAQIRILDQPFVFIDTPGQTHHRSRRIEAMREAIKNPISGIINVVSYGYHESRAVAVEGAFANGVVDPAFLEQQRRAEISMLEEWVPLLGGKDVAGWLATVITKADLWWDRAEVVRAHYETGPYFDALGSAKALNPVVLDYCSVFQKFWGEVPMSGMFTDEDRVRVRAHLLRELLAAIGRQA